MTIFDKDSNKISLNENFNEVNGDTIIIEHVTSLSKDNKNSLRDDNVENIDNINESQMI